MVFLGCITQQTHAQSLSYIILLHHSSSGKEHTMIRDEVIIMIDPTFMQSGIIGGHAHKTHDKKAIKLLQYP
jgi:hypothetical protein